MDKNYSPGVEGGLQRPVILDKSGSCALVVLIVGDQCFIANVGDSRAVLSAGGGLSSFTNLPPNQRFLQGTPKIFPLSRDHKPSDELERKRIIEAGGQIYQ